MLQQEQPDDFVIATGVQHSVREFIVRAPNTSAWSCAGKGPASTRKPMTSIPANALLPLTPATSDRRKSRHCSATLRKQPDCWVGSLGSRSTNWYGR